MQQYVGKRLGAYQILEQIGQGGMATVFKAYQPSMARYVAIKILPASLAGEADFRQRFEREARAVAALRHSNIVQVFDFGDVDVYNTYLQMNRSVASLSSGEYQRVRLASQLSGWRIDIHSETKVRELEEQVRLEIASIDVIHSFWVPEFRIKQDAVPGMVQASRRTAATRSTAPSPGRP